jgi:hypothetical protein
MMRLSRYLLLSSIILTLAAGCTGTTLHTPISASPEAATAQAAQHNLASGDVSLKDIPPAVSSKPSSPMHNVNTSHKDDGQRSSLGTPPSTAQSADPVPSAVSTQNPPSTTSPNVTAIMAAVTAKAWAQIAADQTQHQAYLTAYQGLLQQRASAITQNRPMSIT